MPELPEVEIVRRELARWLAGKRIVRASSSDRWILRGSRKLSAIAGARVKSVGRRGKWLRIALSRGALFLHLGMTGDWTKRRPSDPTVRFERARIDTKDASARYVDSRRFGRIIAASEDIDVWRELGPDPLLDGIDAAKLLHRIKKRKGAIKVALMDQSVLAGVGNILATEALWMARIDPRTPARNIRDVRAIVRCLRRIIERTLAYDLDPSGRSPFRIYGAETCPRCKSKLRRVVLGGRSSTFCPVCQLTIRRRASVRAPRRARRASGRAGAGSRRASAGG
jgi:formamidopyrimidine-DNA glycosylase